MKLLFLDIDGVLNNELRAQSEVYQIDPECAQNFNSLIDRTGAKIVISSSWRLGMTLEDLKRVFEEKGLKGEIIGVTPRLFPDDGYVRGNEILMWLRENESIYGERYYNYQNYLILDDDEDMLYQQRDNFLQTDNYVGLTHNDVDKASWMLRRWS